MSDTNLLLTKILKMKREEVVNSHISNTMFHNEDTYALFIAMVNMAVENATNVKFNDIVYSPIRNYSIPEVRMNHLGYRVPVLGKSEKVDVKWGTRSIAVLSDKYYVIHLNVNQYGSFVEYAVLLRGHDEYIPLTPDNYVPEIFNDIPETMMFWEKGEIDSTYDTNREMDKLFLQLSHYVQHRPGILTEMMGKNDYGII